MLTGDLQGVISDRLKFRYRVIHTGNIRAESEHNTAIVIKKKDAVFISCEKDTGELHDYFILKRLKYTKGFKVLYSLIKCREGATQRKANVNRDARRGEHLAMVGY